jgi:hypothetical protein
MEVRESIKFLEMESAMRTLCPEGVAFPSLTSLEIKINPIEVNDSGPKFYTRFIQTDAIFRILRLKMSHHQLHLFLERAPRKGKEIVFRLVTVEAASSADVRAWPSKAKIAPH